MATGAQRLSTSMQALSYAMGIAKSDEERTLKIDVNESVWPGPKRARSMNATVAPQESMSLEYEPGKPLKNFGRGLAWQAGIPLPYNMQQAADAAEQATLNYQNENEAAGDIFSTFDRQMADAAENAADPSEARLYNNYRTMGMDAAGAFFQGGASEDARAAAMTKLEKIGSEARGVQAADANERVKFVRQNLASEIATSRAGLVSMDMAEKDRVFSTEAELASLDNLKPGSPEEQIALRGMLGNAASRSQSTMASALKGAGAVAGAVPNPYAQVAGVGLQAIGQVLGNESLKLDRDTVVKMVLEQNDAIDKMSEEFRPEVVKLHEGVVEEGKKYGIPGESWSATPITLATPYSDAWRGRLFPEGGSGSPDEPPAPPPSITTNTFIEGLRERFGAGNATPTPRPPPPTITPPRFPVRGDIRR